VRLTAAGGCSSFKCSVCLRCALHGLSSFPTSLLYCCVAPAALFPLASLRRRDWANVKQVHIEYLMKMSIEGNTGKIKITSKRFSDLSDLHKLLHERKKVDARYCTSENRPVPSSAFEARVGVVAPVLWHQPPCYSAGSAPSRVALVVTSAQALLGPQVPTIPLFPRSCRRWTHSRRQPSPTKTISTRCAVPSSMPRDDNALATVIQPNLAPFELLLLISSSLLPRTGGS